MSEIGTGEESIKVQNHEYFSRLFDLGGAGLQGFRDQVARAGGRVRMMVHPYYTVEDWDGVRPGDYYTALKRLLQTESEDKPPMVILEEGGEAFCRTQRRIFDLIPKADRDKIYFVPTYQDDPLPNLEYVGDPEVLPLKIDERKCWGKLRKVLAGAGVKSVLVGGQYMTLNFRESDMDTGELGRQYQRRGNAFLTRNKLGSCAGVTATEMANGFEVEISNIAFPHRRWVALGIKDSI